MLDTNQSETMKTTTYEQIQDHFDGKVMSFCDLRGYLLDHGPIIEGTDQSSKRNICNLRYWCHLGDKRYNQLRKEGLIIPDSKLASKEQRISELRVKLKAASKKAKEAKAEVSRLWMEIEACKAL